MAPRIAARTTRENDFSNVGKIGRRTGVTLPQGRLDVNGMEEITGIFSSPRKPSPLRKSISAADTDVEPNSEKTPSQARSTRKSIPPPRSASPRKSGINGTARRSKTVDVLGQNKAQEGQSQDEEDTENQPVLTPSLSASGPRRFSPEKTPLKDITQSRIQTARTTRQRPQAAAEEEREEEEERIHESVEIAPVSIEISQEPEIHPNEIRPDSPSAIDDYAVAAVGDDEDERASVAASLEDNFEEPPLPPPFDDEEADQTFEIGRKTKPRSREPTVANSRRKRKSDAVEQAQDTEIEVISSPAAKRAKRISNEHTKKQEKTNSTVDSGTKPVEAKKRGRPALKDRDTNAKMSTRQESELNNIIEKVKARPGQKKSLYVLRRETPADDGAARTRSGRVSVKPLAYWRNERCVYGGSPGGANLQDGARFPLNSIREIIRTEEIGEKTAKKPKKSKKSTKAKKLTARTHVKAENGEPSTLPQEDEDEGEVESESDSEAEPWETETGIFRGNISKWDPELQTNSYEEEEIDIAYASASIETREVKGSTFRYAKLNSSKFFGSGVVDLPPGAIKRPKNSRKMHMCFFVATGRVSVQVGPPNGDESRFSVGQGGWWQVPRGNQYSMENEYDKPARIFFSQGCEVILQDEEE